MFKPREDFKSTIKDKCSKNARIIVSRSLYGGNSNTRPVHGLPHSKWGIHGLPHSKWGIHGVNHDRASTNMFDVYISQAKIWAGIPNRQTANFCSTSLGLASRYGRVEIVIPFDNVTAFAYTRFSFDYGRVVGDLINLVKDLVKHVNLIKHNLNSFSPFTKLYLLTVINDNVWRRLEAPDFNIHDIENLSVMIKELGEVLDGTTNFECISAKSYLKWIRNTIGDKTLLAFIKDEITPENLAVHVCSSIEKIPLNAQEIWFEGSYVGITPRSTDEIKEVIRGIAEIT